ncbi:MAG TPA: glycoside hydrolase family 20 zincin-like fold domain-containing protein, partial [bacterium]|nr:glycoside hydrolase family 20 zincin-like fold domain-containing protein [bacterium]
MKRRSASIRLMQVIVSLTLCVVSVDALGDDISALMPCPRETIRLEKVVEIGPRTQVVLYPNPRTADRQAAVRIQRLLSQHLGVSVPVVNCNETGYDSHSVCIGQGLSNAHLTRLLAKHGLTPSVNREGFTLILSRQGIGLWGNDDDGVRHGSFVLERILGTEVGVSGIPEVILKDYSVGHLRGVWVKPERSNLKALRTLVGGVFPRCRVNLMLLDLSHVSWDPAVLFVDSKAVSLEEVSDLARYAQQKGISIVPCVDFLGDKRWVSAKSSDSNNAPDEDSPRYLFHLKDLGVISRILESYAEIHRAIASGFFHIGFR